MPGRREQATDAAVARAVAAFEAWRDVPAPRRGELVRLLGEELRREKEALGALVTLEVGKIAQEGLGEVQEMIDICDFAVGLSRQLYGSSIASERPGHRLTETWHPLGPVAVISAFNFPVAVWSWNAALALVCGDPVIWKPSERTPLTAIATTSLLRRAADRFGDVPDGLFELVLGGADRAVQLAEDERIPLVSATGSTAMGKALAPRIAARLGRSLLELGGNNAAIVAPSADLDLVVRAVLFSAVGTAGQRCTSLRRLIVHESVADDLVERLAAAYRSVPIGDPREEGTLVGPLVTGEAFGRMEAALGQARDEGGEVVVGGGRAHADRWPDAWYAEPTIVRMPAQTDVVAQETFAPILYVLTYRDLDEAIALQNGVPQGLASSIFTTDLREAERFLAAAGSDCGIANVNIGPSGAEIGGAFGGEKETGGGRESGSDAWRAYMRRQTATVNFTSDLPLAQGIEFGIDRVDALPAAAARERPSRCWTGPRHADISAGARPATAVSGEPLIAASGIWKIFGPKADRILGTPDAELTRAELREKTGCVAAVRDVSFEVWPGEVFVVMGLSGSGKSTLVRTLIRLIEPTAGAIRIGGQDVTAASACRAARAAPPLGLDGLPALRAARPPARDRQRRVRARDPRDGEGRAARPCPRAAGARRPRGRRATSSPTSSRAGCSSASASRARSRRTRR